MGAYKEMYIIKRDDVIKDKEAVLRKLKMKQWFKGKVKKEFIKYTEELK